MRPVRATALYIARSLKAFALTGRQVTAQNNPGRCPGLRASAPSGRVGKNLKKSKVSIMYARVECYFLYKGGDVLHYDSRKP